MIRSTNLTIPLQNISKVIALTLVGVALFCFDLSAQVMDMDSLGQQVNTDTVSNSDLSNAIILEGFIEQNKTLEAGKTYLVQHNVKVSKGAVLTVPAGTTIYFDHNTSLVIEGGLDIQGEPNNFVQLTSADEEFQGMGILVRGNEGEDISIEYASFRKLIMPLNFDVNWYRAKVTIQNCLFKEMNTGEPNIMITSPLSSLYTIGDKKCEFTFSQNDFVHNWGSIYIENFQDNVLDLRFDDNLLTNNVVYGIDKGIPSNTPLFGYFDDGDKRFLAEIKGNSIFSNYQINAATDTIIREISVGIQGEGESFNIPGNYFRSQDDDYISSTLDHFYQNNTLPLLKPSPVLDKPNADVHAHIYKVTLDNEEVLNYSEIPADVQTANVNFTVYFNRPVTEFGETQMEYIYYDTINNGLRKDNIDLTEGTWSENNMAYSFTVSDGSFMKSDLGYVIIKNFKDNDGFEVPDFTIGQRNAINNYSRLYNKGAAGAGTYYPPAEIISNPGGFIPDPEDLETLQELGELGDLSLLGAYTSLAKTWEVGIQAGTMNYMGDLQSNFMDKNDFRWDVSAFAQYNISKWFSARAAFVHGRVAGNDIDESELGRQRRVANFQSNIWAGSLTFHFHLLQYGISKGEKFSPSIFTGITVLGYKPEARIFTGLNFEGEPTYLAYIDGTFQYSTSQEAGRGDFVWVPLRPIGTEGQTTGGVTDDDPNGVFSRKAPKQYKKWTIGIPFGVSFDFIINKSWIIGVEGNFTLTFTDYLDDISGFYFDRQIDPATGNPHQAIIDANPTIAGHLGGVRGASVELPNSIYVITPSLETAQVPTAALLANPSLAKAVRIDNRGNIYYVNGLNDAYTFPSAKKGDSNRDWMTYFSIKVSKVFGYNRIQKKATNSSLDEL